MKLSLFLIVAVILIVTQSDAKRIGKHFSRRANSNPALDFIKGFALGVEMEISPASLDQCVDDTKLTFEYFETAYTEIDYAFRHLSVAHMERGIMSLASGVSEIGVALRDCNATEIVEDITRIVEELQSGTSGILKFVVEEALKIWHHSTDLSADFKNFLHYWKEQNYSLAGVQVGKIFGVLIEKSESNEEVHLLKTRFERMVSFNSKLSCFVHCLGKGVDVWKLIEVIGECKEDKKCYVEKLGEKAIGCIDKCL